MNIKCGSSRLLANSRRLKMRNLMVVFLEGNLLNIILRISNVFKLNFFRFFTKI
jgi:hypothetical protein